MALLLIVGTILLAVFFYKIRKDYFILSLAKKIKTVDGSDINAVAPTAEGASIFGNNLDFIGASNEEIFMWTRRKAIKYRKSFLQYMIATPVYNIITPEDAELVFNDMNLITKGMVYRFMRSFVGTGLLTSTGQKWHSRRKMLTPAFHFNILEQFLEIFKEESQKFVDLLEKKDGEVISLTEMIPRLTLNTICETALGVKLDNLKDGDTYRKHLDGIEQAMVERTSNPLYFSDFFWKCLGKGRKFQVHYDGVHKFSSDIIEKKRALFKKMENSNENSKEADDADDIFFSKKRRYAMLDTLLMAEKEGHIDHNGICEEVDTFIFEGFDTTSMGLMYGIMTFAQYPEIQQKCFEEVDSMIDDDLKNLTTVQINKLEYLERFVKETLRLYPSVPTIIREVTRDTALSNNIFLPRGTQILIHIYDINRHPKHYENPDQFDPDRFLPENSKGRHPFSYVPFSAGSRNCIGQKFALYEMKTVLIYFLKNFQVFQIQDAKECRYESGFLLRVSHNIKVRIEKRKK